MQPYEPATREQVQKLLDDTIASSDSGKINRRKQKKRTPSQMAGSVISSLVVVALLIVLGSLVRTRLEGGYAQLFGYRIFKVETGSMIPTLPIGSFIITHEPEEPALLPVGTVITYKHESAVITHRITRIENEYDDNGVPRLVFVTQGDNPENSEDPWRVQPENILGEMVWHLSLPF